MKAKNSLFCLIPAFLARRTPQRIHKVHFASHIRRMLVFLPFVFFLLSFVFSSVSAQSPQSFNYQAVARSNGEILKNTTLDVRLSLLQGSENGNTAWTETQTVTTNDFGLFTIQAGSNTPVDVDWSQGPYFLKVEADLKDGNGFNTMGVTQLQSVPYALYAAGVADKDDADADPHNELQDLQLNGNILTITKNDAATPIDLSPYLDNPGWEKIGSDTLTYPGSVAVGTSQPGGSKLSVQGDDVLSGKPLFDVKRKDGQTVFAVYNEGVRVYVKKDSKNPHEGFAVGGYNETKQGEEEYFRISGSPVPEVVKGENRMLWYPQKNAFLAGKIVVDNPDSVGNNSFATGYEPRASGEYSQAMGYKPVAGGDYSTAIGANVTARGTGATAIGYESSASGDFSVAMGYQASTNGKKGSFVFSDHSIGNSLKSTALNQFMVRASGGVYFYTNSDLTSGVSLHPGGNVWYSVSDRKKKENFQDVDPELLIGKLSEIPIQSWNYKSQNPAIRHIGIVAQDFYQNFGYGDNDTTLAWIDVAGVNMAVIKGLISRTDTLEKQLEEQRRLIVAQREEMDRLRKENSELAQLKKQVEELKALVSGIAKK